MSMKLLDVVALLEDEPKRGLLRGQVGTAVGMLAPGVFEIEFNDSDGKTYATVVVPAGNCLCCVTK
jgi:hypothetical protein